jgi:hypothetical protein
MVTGQITWYYGSLHDYLTVYMITWQFTRLLDSLHDYLTDYMVTDYMIA